MTYTRKEVIGDCVLMLGDCLGIMPTLGKVDRSVFDPPYGTEKIKKSGLRKSRKSKTKYNMFDDTEEYVKSVVIPATNIAIAASKSCALTCGFKNMWNYPKPDHVGTFQYRGSTVMSCWGPALWQPILYYGKDPYRGRLLPDSFVDCNDVDRETNHPCPKPLKQWSRLVARSSRIGEVILDPFMGSGTTLVACAKMGRKGIGIELDESYFQIACRRVEEAYRQSDLFIQAPKADEPVQERLFDE